jgi:beta-N-acetylhexosaminidase
MDIRKRLGELLMVGFMGEEMDALLATHIRDLQPAGLIFFKRNIRAPEQLAQLTHDIQTLALQEFGRPLLLAVDQEGGSVARMGPPFTQIPDAVSLGKSGVESVHHYSRLTAREMFQVGLNLNLAPVLDVNTTGAAGVMERRSFGDDPSLVAQCGIAAISATQDENIMATAKHFPGLGRAQDDPHHDLPVVSVDREELERTDLPPFSTAIQADVACVMTSHTLYPALDPENPGTFSPTILRNLLRAQLGFQGVIITDDLEMGAVGERYSQADASVAALQAGADLLLVCNDLKKMHLTADVVLDGLNRGLLDPQDLALSLNRVAKLRKTYLDPPHLADVATVATYFPT